MGMSESSLRTELSSAWVLSIFFLENRLIDGDLRRDALSLQKSGDWDDAGPQLAEASGSLSGGTALKPGILASQDDEYRWAGVEDPKVMITTSREPSARLKKFAKVMNLLIS